MGVYIGTAKPIMTSPEISGHLGSSMIDQTGGFNQERGGLKKKKTADEEPRSTKEGVHVCGGC